MYPLNAILIGRNDQLLPQVRRELMNCSCQIEAEYPDVGSAVVALRPSIGEKRVVILHLGTPPELDALSRLNVGLPGWPILVLMDEENHSNGSHGAGIISIMRAGATQIVSLPLQSHDFKEVLERIAVQFVFAVKESKVIAVAGATGGTGGTTIAINLAFEIAHQHGLRCVLVDLSLRMGVVACHLNLVPTNTIVDLLRDVTRVDPILVQQVLINVTDNFQVLAGPQEFVAPSAIKSQDVTHVINVLKQIASVVVLDVPCTYDDTYFDALSSAGQVVLIGEQKLPSIRALRMVHDRLGRPSGTEFVAINRFDSKNSGFAVDRLLNPLGVSRLFTIARDDPGMAAALEGGCVLRRVAPRSPALTDIVTLANSLINLDSPAPVKPVGLFSRLSRALANK
jgi:pilus assembly protein CpaE